MSIVIVVSFLFLNLLILLGGLAVIGYFFPQSRLAERLLALAVFWTAQVSLTVLVLGLLGGLSLLLLSATTLLVSVVIISIFQNSVSESVSALAGSARMAVRRLVGSRSYILYLMLLVVGVQAAATVRKIYYLPPYVYDELNLHLVPVIVWFQEQRIPLEIDTPVTRVNSNPLGAQLVHFWFVKFFRDLTWVELPQFLFSFVILLACYQLMRFLYVRRRSALIFALLIYTVPIFLIESRTCQDHLLLTALFLAALVFAVKAMAGEHRYLWLMAAAGGLMIGIKVSGPLYFVAAGLAWIVTNPAGLGLVSRNLLKSYVKVALAFLVVAALGGFWYLKNFLSYGSLQGIPLKPQLPLSPEPLVSAALMRNDVFVYLGTFANNWSQFFTRLTDTASDYSSDLPSISGFGIQFFAFGILGYLLTAVIYLAAPRKRRLAGFLLLTAVSLQLMYFFLYYSTFSYRLFLATPALGIVLWAYIFSLVRPALRHVRIVEVLALLMAGFCCFTTYYSERTSPLKSLHEWETLPNADRTTTSYSGVTQGVWETIDQYVPPDCPIAYIAGEDALITPYYGNLMTRRVFHVNSLPPELDSATRRARTLETIRALRAKGVRLVHVNEGKAPEGLRDLPELGENLYLLP